MKITEFKNLSIKRQHKLSMALKDFPMVINVELPTLNNKEKNDLFDNIYPICAFSQMGLVYKFNLHNRTASSRNKLMECVYSIGELINE